MVADVPVGALLSGGIDSSLIVALMQRHSTRPVRTFTVAFAEQSFDESASAAAVARHLGTDHTTIEMPAREVLDLVPKLPEIWDEPFSDSSQLPTHLVAEVARRSVTVALSGDGGDELFAGYNRHAWLDRVWRWAAPVPHGLRRRVGAAACLVPPGAVDTTAGLLPQRWQVRMPSTKVVKLGRVLQASSVQEAYRSLTAHWEHPAELVPGVRARPSTEALDDTHLRGWDGEGDVTAQLLKSDLVSYLPDDVLTKVDRASMAVSLETRAPFLDRGVLEAAWRLPTSTKVRDGKSKWVLRRILYRHVPPALVDRPKMGFGVPLAEWLRGPLRPWAEDLLSPDALDPPRPARSRSGPEGMEAPHRWQAGPRLRALGRLDAPGVARSLERRGNGLTPLALSPMMLSPAMAGGTPRSTSGCAPPSNAASPIRRSRLSRSVGPLSGSPARMRSAPPSAATSGSMSCACWEGSSSGGSS